MCVEPAPPSQSQPWTPQLWWIPQKRSGNTLQIVKQHYLRITYQQTFDKQLGGKKCKKLWWKRDLRVKRKLGDPFETQTNRLARETNKVGLLKIVIYWRDLLCLLQAGIITTNRSSLNTDCGVLPNITASHNLARSNIYIRKHQQITQSPNVPCSNPSILNISKGNFGLWLHNCPAQCRLQHCRAASPRCEEHQRRRAANWQLSILRLGLQLAHSLSDRGV